MIKLNTAKHRILCLILAVTVCAAGIIPTLTAAAAGTPTSLGLADHGIKAHRDGWLYVYGGKGQVISGNVRGTDCAGLIYSYFSDMGAIAGCCGGASSQVESNCVFSNDISEGIPRIHGLALTMPDYYDPYSGLYGHIGIYIGNNEATDNSDTDYNMRREPVVGSGRNWTAWHVFDNGMRYPTNGWYALDGKMVHYTGYEYDVNTTVDGYTIGADGFARKEDGSYATVDTSILSSDYCSAGQVAAYLGGKYSGKDSTYDLIFGGASDEPEHEFNGKITANGVRLRAEANTSSGIVTVLSKGNGVDISEEVTGESVTNKGSTSDKWYHVTAYNGQTGYVSALFVERIVVSAPQAPVITAANGYVTITSDSGADIYYTVDGTTPTTASTPYTNSVYMTACTYRAIAVKNGMASAVTSATVMSNSSIFTDLSTDAWYFQPVDKAISAGIFKGNGNGIFTPNKPITREQFVTAIANLDGVDLSAYADTSGFSDVTNMTYDTSRAVSWAYKLGIIDGFPDGTFHPTEPVSREQMCVILTRYANITRSENSVPFADDSAISAWAKDAVYACRDNGLVNGIGANLFDPKGTATRAQACVITVNLNNM